MKNKKVVKPVEHINMYLPTNNNIVFSKKEKNEPNEFGNILDDEIKKLKSKG